jgi:glycosyltransferase involved in cell wall biosynthesis
MPTPGRERQSARAARVRRWQRPIGEGRAHCARIGIGETESSMRITWLLETADQLWGGVKVALEDANWLQRRGHDVTVVARSGPPAWMQLECAFRQVASFHAEHLPDGDVIVATFWTTVPWAASAPPQKGVPVHLCQGYEGDNAENAALRDRIESVYRLRGVRHVTISPHLTRLLRERFGADPHEIAYAIDHRVHFPGPERAPGTPLRVGLVGPYAIPWKDLATGYEACRLAHAAGQRLVLVRASNVPKAPAEQQTAFPLEWHPHVPPSRMGDFYRSLDVLLATSSGAEEGFFLPAVEAMACGVPVVMTDVPCFREHRARAGNDEYGLFVPPKDPVAMAEALVVAGSLAHVRAALRANGIALAATYHPDRHGEQLEAALRSCADAHAGGGALKLVADVPATGADGDDALAAVRVQLQRLAEQLQRRGAAPAAARALSAASCLAPDDHAIAIAAARALLDAGDAGDALRTLDALAARGVDDEALHVARGHALHALARMPEAAQAFRAALAVGARTADAYNRLGVVLFQAGDVRGARQSFERALVLQPGHGDARANLSALPAA